MNKIKTATLVAKHTELKPGMDVSLIIYHGNDVHIAEEIYNYLCDCKNHDIPVPLDGTEFRIRVEDGEIQSSNDYGNYSTKYKIILKGVLI